MLTPFPPLMAAYTEGQTLLKTRPESVRKAYGQFLTPPAVAQWMANQLGRIQHEAHILDPAVGSGVLVCAVIERLIQEQQPTEIWIDAYEIDDALGHLAQKHIKNAMSRAKEHGICIHFQFYTQDFIADTLRVLQPTLFSDTANDPAYTHVIANPPYFKLDADTYQSPLGKNQLQGHTNIYTLFMSAALQRLGPMGIATFLVPRSFCSGAYFARFRADFLRRAAPTHIHLFESRHATFKSDTVLQENILFSFTKALPQNHMVKLSTSYGHEDLTAASEREIPQTRLVAQRGKTVILRLPLSSLDDALLEIMDQWEHTLGTTGLAVSTGPIVPFRQAQFLNNHLTPDTIPLLWMHHIQPQEIRWSIQNNKKDKPAAFSFCAESRPFALPNSNYVILRRFSTKEDKRRLIAAPWLAVYNNQEWLGLENHLNYIYHPHRELSDAETIGLAAYYNSGLADRYFRLGNGNTQVNAQELRELPLPSFEVLRAIGHHLMPSIAASDLDTLVTETLKMYAYLPTDFPIIRESRYHEQD